MDVQVSFPLAFAAGFVSVLSACVLPLVPGYLAFVTALTVAERTEHTTVRARRAAVVYSGLFMVGFGLVFLSLGLVATPVGTAIARSLPWIQRAGGALLAVWGLHLAGAFEWLDWRPAARSASEEPRGIGPAPGGREAGSLLTGVAFGAGWTPCIGPVLGSILLYASREETMSRGVPLLVTYALGLSLPFLALSVGLNRPLAGSRRLEPWMRPLRRAAGGVLAALGLALLTGYFAQWAAFLAGLGQLINLEL